jgi:hypothetical protein
MATLTPDRPSLTEREAIAVVKSWLARVPTGDSNCLDVVQLYGYGEGLWTGEYLGMGEWLVSVTEMRVPGRMRVPGSWRVFEASSSVVRDREDGDMLGRLGC